MNGSTQLKIAAFLSFIAALLHVAIIFGGPEWYRFFGAGEGMAQLAESGSTEPTVITFSIAIVLTVWGLYALSGAGVVPKLPLLKLALCLISAVFLLRGVAGFILPIFTNHPVIAQNSVTFWLVSSSICCVFGVFYILGTKNNWERMSNDVT
jgi:putative oxidoreductase